MKRKNLHTLLIWALLFVFTLTVCSAFLRPHYTHDSYKIIRDGYEKYSYNMYLKESRPLTAMLTIFAGTIDLPIEVYMIISFIISIAILSFSVVVLYKIFETKLKNLNAIKRTALILISYIVIFGYSSIEHIIFLETCIMALGVLLSVLAARTIINNEKYKWIKAFLMIFIGVFCYQGSIAIFPIILLTYYAIIEQVSPKEYIKLTIKAAILYGISMFLSLAYVKVFFGGSRIQMGKFLSEIDVLIDTLKHLIVDSLGIIPPFVHIGIIVCTSIFLLCFYKQSIKEKIYLLVKYILIILAAISICIMPTAVGSGLSIEPRMCMAYGSTIGISLLFMYWITANSENHSRVKNLIVYGLTFTIFILTAILYNTLTIQHLETNKFDKEICNKIDKIISEYEEETGIKITKIAGTYDQGEDWYIDGFIKTRAYNQRATSSWALRETLIFYTKRPMNFMPITLDQYIEFFDFKDWSEFSEEQIVIQGDTIYFCAY